MKVRNSLLALTYYTYAFTSTKKHNGFNMVKILNLNQLTENGETAVDRKARKLALRSLEAAVNAVDPQQIIRTKVRLENSTLRVDEYGFDLAEFQRIFVVGGGKASGRMAEALEETLKHRITSGVVNVPKTDRSRTEIIKLHKASHPIPDESGVEGTRQIMQIAEQAEKNDLVISLISGGGSSLMPLPRGQISIADKKKITDALLKCGATISEINTVRKHISDFKGGWLAEKAYPATILNLILSDVVGDPLDFIASGPTVPDSTTFADGVNVLKKYHLWDGAPESIRKVLRDGVEGLIPETPKAGNKAFRKTRNVVIGNNRCASSEACSYLRSAGLNTFLLTSTLEGEAKQVGAFFAAIIREIVSSGNPAARPSAIVAGGETTVIVKGKGRGGRNQEIPLAAALKLCRAQGVVVASLATDGIDGPTDAAGAIVDGKTMLRAAKAGLAPEAYLAENDSYSFFSSLADLIFTGPTGTNVNDISVLVAL